MCKIKPTEYLGSSYNCPHCKAFAQMEWIVNNVCIEEKDFFLYSCGMNVKIDTNSEYKLGIVQCKVCHGLQIWLDESMIYPVESTIELANKDMPIKVKEIYEEACSIFNKSPRASAALLRLGVQILCKELGEKGKNINDDIASLVKKGLPTRVQKALDVIRVIGNNAVHPGSIDLNDNRESAVALFRVTNIIVEEMITKPKEIDELYSMLPENALKAIEKRDNN